MVLAGLFLTMGLHSMGWAASPCDQLIGQKAYPWLNETLFFGSKIQKLKREDWDYLEQLIGPPKGYQREAVAEKSFAQWLRCLPVYKKPNRPLHFYTGRIDYKDKPWVHRIVALDTDHFDDGGRRQGKGLQQCADVVIRLWAEYLFWLVRMDIKQAQDIRFTDYEAKMLSPQNTGQVDHYRAFRHYLWQVFARANTQTLADHDLDRLSSWTELTVGDLLLFTAIERGRRLGHTVMLVDIVSNSRGERKALMLHGRTPAREAYIVRTAHSGKDPWHPLDQRQNNVSVKETIFSQGDLYRFANAEQVELTLEMIEEMKNTTPPLIPLPTRALPQLLAPQTDLIED